MKKYLKVFDVGLQNIFVYRWNFLIRALFGLLPLFGTIFIWRAIFQEKGQGINNYDFGDMVFYFLLVLFLENLITPVDDESQVATDIRDGQMNAYLVRPLNYLLYRFCLFTSSRILYTVVTLPVILVVFAAFSAYLRWPAQAQLWLMAGVSVALAGLLQFFISFCVALLAFWMLEISTVVFIIYSFEYFLSGHMFPLGFMPQTVQRILEWFPFPYEMYFPIAIFTQQVSGASLWRGLTIQLGWVLVMGVSAHLLWNQGLRRYQAVGG